MDRKIAAGAVHVYRLSAQTDQVVDLTIDQAGSNPSASLWSPEGKLLLDLDVARLFAVAESSGEYRLEIASARETAAGGYRVHLRPLRPAGERDRHRARAAARLSEAEQLRREGVERKAVEAFEDALALWKRVGDSGWAAETSFRLGLAHMALDRFPQAVSVWENETLPAWKGKPRESHLLNLIGDAHMGYGKAAEALDRYRESLRIAYHRKDRVQQLHALTDLIYVYFLSGELQEALSTFETAQSLGVATAKEQAILLDTAAELFLAVGDFERTVDFAVEAKRQGERSDAPDVVVNALRTEGLALYQMRQHERALEVLFEARELAIKQGDISAESGILNAIATVRVDSYEQAEASRNALAQADLDLLEALRLSQKAGAPWAEANALAYLCRVRDLRNRGNEALRLCEQAFEKYTALKYPIGVAGTWYGRARAWHHLGNLGNAEASLDAALGLTQEVRDRPQSAQFRAVFLASRGPMFDFKIQLLLERDRLQPGKGYDRKAFDLAERLRGRTLLEELARRDWSTSRIDPRLRQQLEETERRLRELGLSRTVLGEEPMTDRAPVGEDVRDLLVRAELLRAQMRASAAGDADPPESLGLPEIQRRVLEDDALILAYTLLETQSVLWMVDRDSWKMHLLPVGEQEIEELAALVTDALAETGRGEPDQWKAAVNAAGRLGRILLGPAADDLGDRPLVIIPDGLLFRVPFEALPDPRLPMTGPPDAGEWPVALAERNQVSYALSATLLAHIRATAEKRPAPRQELLGVGDPVFEGDPRRGPRKAPVRMALASPQPFRSVERSLPRFWTGKLERLTGSAREVDAISRWVSADKMVKLVGFEANRDRILNMDLAGFRYLHFATHSTPEEEHSALSGLVLSMFDRDGKPQNWLLSASDIYDLDIPAEMVVLSACRTGRGEEIKGEGVIGLARAFFHAGASRVVVSLWPVDDVATSAFMKRFYKGVLVEKLPPATALHRAKLWMMQQPQWRAPYYWAPFVLQGDWR